MATKQPKLYRQAQMKLYCNRGNQDVTSRTNAATMGKKVTMATRVRINRSVTIRVLHKVGDDDNDDLCGFYCLIFGFLQWSRENKHNAGFRNFLIFTKLIK
jgi:hypothetical protein